MGRLRLATALCAAAVLFTGSGALAQPSYWLFESMPSRPMALSADATRLYVVNTPDGYLEIFDVSGATPMRIGSVPVGLEPIAVALRTPGEAWVVNHLSDSVSIVDLAATPPRVVRTLLVGDAPGDIVFASGRAFVTTARRGQNTPDPTGDFLTEGIGRAHVWVFDAASPGADLLPTPLVVIPLFTDRPRALAVSPDGTTVYAAGFYTGNRTTTINEGIVCNGAPEATCMHGALVAPGGLPAPQSNAQNIEGPDTGLIVRFDGSKWVDELMRDWSAFVRFSLPDEDVFAIDATLPTPAVVRPIAGVGTVLFGMATNPQNGHLYVASTEAMNHIRFEGPGTIAAAVKPAGVPASVRGHLHEARIAVIDDDSVVSRHLNPHLDYDANPQPASARELSLAQPVGLAVSGDGTTLYVAAFASNVLAVLPVDAIEDGSFAPATSQHVALTGGGPTGVVLDEARDRAFVTTRYDDGLSVVELSTRAQVAHVTMHTPEPAAVVYGRPFLYDARLTSSTGEAACGSCHVFGDADQLAWDLGNPDGPVESNFNPVGPIAFGQPFHPMKGPMTTQTFRGIATHGPMHWRGDRTGGGSRAGDERLAFAAFNPAFEGLLGRESMLTPAEMQLFTDFVLRLALPPNPIRRLENTLRDDEAAGRTIFFDRNPIDSVATCNGCHTLDASQGFFGTGGLMTFENEPQELKVAHLRNLYEKVGMFGMPDVDFISSGDNLDKGPQVRGFGYLHDGSVDTVFRFLRATVFSGFASNTERRQVEAYMMVFDSDLAPIVGQQVTIDSESTAAELGRLDLLVARAGTVFTLMDAPGAKECDLVAKGVVAGEARGFLFMGSDTFASDRTAEGTRTKAQMLALAGSAGNHLTFLCTPPGSGFRMGLDRDEDGTFDRDELDSGSDPASRPVPPNPVGQPDAGLPDASMFPDAATPNLTDGDDGCGCRVGSAGGGSVVALLLFLLVGFAIVRRR